MDKKGVFVGETENGFWVEIPSKGTRWVFLTLEEALAKAKEIMEEEK